MSSIPSPDSPPMTSGVVVYRRLLGYGQPYWKMFSLSIVAMILYAALGPAFAKLIQPLIDGSFIRNDPEILRQTPLILLGLSLLRGITGFAGDYCSGWVSRRVIADLRQELFDKLVQLPCPYYDQSSGGQLLSKLLYNTEQVSNSLTRGIMVALREGMTIIGLTALMFYENLMLSLVFMVIGPMLGISIRQVNKRFRKISMRIQESMGNVGHVAQEAIDGQRIVKVFNGKAYESARFLKENERNQLRQMKLISADAISSAIIQFIYISGIATILYIVSVESVRQTVTPGSLISFIAAMAMMMSPIKRVTQVLNILQRGIAAGDSIFEMLDKEGEKDTGTVHIESTRGHIEYRKVCLNYGDSDQYALKDINLTVEPGQTIALVGHSGSGKTSLIRLLPRLYEPTSGEILLDGQNIRDLTLESLRAQIAYVGQEVNLFNDTLANNIAYGCREAVSMETIREAARAAHALDFIEQLPDGFETVVGQQGIVLSGGQRQRIAIARALLRNSPILILDEATSALDAESERRVQAALEKLMQNRTTLVIAHRLSTIQNADRIYVVRNGRIVESGTHQELIEARSSYAELHTMQFGRQGDS